MTITKRVVVTAHALQRFRERIDPFINEQTVIKAVGRACLVRPSDPDFKSLIPNPNRDHLYFFEPQRNLLFVIKEDRGSLFVKTVFRPDAEIRQMGRVQTDREATSMSTHQLLSEHRALLADICNHPKGSMKRVALGKRLNAVQHELGRRKKRGSV